MELWSAGTRVGRGGGSVGPMLCYGGYCLLPRVYLGGGECLSSRNIIR